MKYRKADNNIQHFVEASDHFSHVEKMVSIGSEATRTIEDIGGSK
jgi:hypothetical protein